MFFLFEISYYIQIALKCSNNVDLHSTAIYFLKKLSIFSWEAKILIMVASTFSINLGEFSPDYDHKGLANKLSILKGNKSSLVPSYTQELVTEFITSVLHLTKCIVELAQSFSHNSSPIIPVACYWIFTSILAYASYLTHLPSIDSE